MCYSMPSYKLIKNMNKNIIFLLILLPLILTACGTKNESKTATQSEKPAAKFSLKNALTAGQSVKCVYEVDGQSVTTIAKGEKFKIDGIGMMGEAKAGGMVSDGTYMYTWDNDTKKGTKYDIKAMQDLASESPNPQATSQSDQFDFGSWADTQENKYKIDCQEALLTDAEFNPPDDVVFQDITQSMINMSELGKKMQANPSSVPSAEDLEGMAEILKGMGANIPEFSPEPEEAVEE